MYFKKTIPVYSTMFMTGPVNEKKCCPCGLTYRPCVETVERGGLNFLFRQAHWDLDITAIAVGLTYSPEYEEHRKDSSIMNASKQLIRVLTKNILKLW